MRSRALAEMRLAEDHDARELRDADRDVPDSPKGIGYCHGKVLQGPERRGTWRNPCGTVAGIKMSVHQRSFGLPQTLRSDTSISPIQARHAAEFDFRYNNRIAIGVDDVERGQIALRRFMTFDARRKLV